MVAEKLLLLIAQWMLDKVTQFVDDSSGVRLHVLVPKKLQILLISSLPATANVVPVAVVQKACLEKTCKILESSRKNLFSFEMMKEGDNSVFGISSHVNDFAFFQQFWRQKVKGKMRFDHSSPFNILEQLGSKILVEDLLDAGCSDCLLDILPRFKVEIIDKSPHNLLYSDL